MSTVFYHNRIWENEKEREKNYRKYRSLETKKGLSESGQRGTRLDNKKEIRTL